MAHIKHTEHITKYVVVQNMSNIMQQYKDDA